MLYQQSFYAIKQHEAKHTHGHDARRSESLSLRAWKIQSPSASRTKFASKLLNGRMSVRWRIVQCRRDRGMPRGRLYDREGMATVGRQNPETRWVEVCLVLYLCVLAISNRCSKDSSCAHKFDPVSIFVNELLKGVTIALPAGVVTALRLVRIASHWMFASFLAGTCTTWTCIFLEPMGFFSKPRWQHRGRRTMCTEIPQDASRILGTIPGRSHP